MYADRPLCLCNDERISRTPRAALHLTIAIPMKASLRERLIRVEQQFLLAVASNDEKSLSVFAQEWSQLAHDIQSAKVVGSLDENTALLLSHVSQAIDSVTCCMLESGAILQEAQSCSIGHFILDVPPDDQSEVSHHPQEVAPCHLLFSSPHSSTAPGVLGQQQLLDSYAYRWLMQNLHDPYPTSVQMQIISDVSRTSVAQVEHWFQEVRDSIGWTKLSREFFAGSIDATVAAARRFYLEGHINVSFDVVFAFTSVKTFAETLFLEHPSLQAENVDEDVAQTFQSVGMDLGDPLHGNDHISSASNLSMPLDTFSGLSVNGEHGVEDTTPPPSVAGCKRRLTEDIYSSQILGLQRPEKRLRCELLYQLLCLTENVANCRTPSTGGDLTLRSIENSHCSSPMGARPLESVTTPSSDEASTSPVVAAACPSYMGPSLSPPASGPRKRGRADFEVPSERAAHSPDSLRTTRRQRLSDSASPSSPKQLRCPRVIPESNLLREFDTSSKVSLPSDTPLTGGGLVPSIFQAPIGLGPPLDLSVYDWSTMPIPCAETAPLTCM